MGKPLRDTGKGKEVPEAPPTSSKLVGFWVINSLHVKRITIDNPNVALYYREDEEGARFFYENEHPLNGTVQKDKILYVFFRAELIDPATANMGLSIR